MIQNEAHFRFNKAQIILVSAYVVSALYMMLFEVMPQQVEKYPPEKHDLKDSLLTPFLGKKRDCHDDQWQAFRSNLPIMLIAMFSWKYFVTLICGKNSSYLHQYLRSFWLGFTILIFTYRADIFLFLFLILLWFFYTKALYKYRIIVPLSWIIVILVLYLNEKYDHLRFLSQWFEQIIPNSLAFFKNSQAPLLWTNILNMNFLRMLSFTLDCHWGYSEKKLSDHREKCSQGCRQGNLCYRGRDLYKMPKMTLRNYLDYMFYAPTCLAGPPISYTNFFSFDDVKTNVKPPYLRCAILLIFFEIYQHYYPNIHPNTNQNLIEMSTNSLFFLYFIYLKFLVIWRVGRLWSLMYGIDVIDNMGRCMFNNYGFQKFWRMWHKGFNHWLIRYLYVPLGGNKNFVSILCVILFVAFWHDHTIKILVWAIILVIFMIPEIGIKAYFRKRYKHLYQHHWFKYICAFACSFYIQIICYCNLIGFGYGFENAKLVIYHIQNEWTNFALITVTLTFACILMFYIRQIEEPKRND